MNFKSITFVLFSVTLFTNVTGAQNPIKIRIDPKHAYGGNISEYFNAIEYIPLETTKESLFGDISNLIITDDSFVITDHDTRSILFFEPTGKFIKKIKFPGNRAPVIMYNDMNKTLQINYHDIETETIKSKKNFTIYGEEMDDLQITTNGKNTSNIILEPGYSIKFNKSRIETLAGIKDSTIYLIEVYKGDSLYNQFLPVNPYESPGFCYFAGNLNSYYKAHYVQNGTLLISIPIENSIYAVDKDKAVKVFDVIFPANREFPKEVLQITDLQVLDSLKQVPRSPNLIYNLENIFLDKGRLIFKGQSPLYVSNMNTGDPNYIFNFIYNTKTGHVVAMERLVPDASSCYLPVFNPRDNLMIEGVKYYKANYYSYISSLDMFFARDATKDKKPKYPEILQSYFTSQNRKSNPVIVRMKLKE